MIYIIYLANEKVVVMIYISSSWLIESWCDDIYHPAGLWNVGVMIYISSSWLQESWCDDIYHAAGLWKIGVMIYIIQLAYGMLV